LKKLLMIGVAFFLLAGAAMAAERIVFADLELVFNEFYKTQLAKSRMDVQQKDIEAERLIMTDEMTLISGEVDALKKEARDVTLSQEIRDQKRLLYEERVLELQEKQKEITDFVSRRQQQMQMQVNRMSKTIMDEIRESIVEYAKQEGLLAVIDSSKRQAVVGVFLYTHSDVDISQDILAMLNSKRPDVMEDGGDLVDDEAVTEEVKEEASKTE